MRDATGIEARAIDLLEAFLDELEHRLGADGFQRVLEALTGKGEEPASGPGLSPDAVPSEGEPT